MALLPATEKEVIHNCIKRMGTYETFSLKFKTVPAIALPFSKKPSAISTFPQHTQHGKEDDLKKMPHLLVHHQVLRHKGERIVFDNSISFEYNTLRSKILP